MRTQAKRTQGRTVIGGEPVTLEQAEDILRRQRPALMASAEEWRAHHERAARVYQAVAEVDTRHHFEALALAALERDGAAKVSSAVAASAEKPG